MRDPSADTANPFTRLARSTAGPPPAGINHNRPTPPAGPPSTTTPDGVETGGWPAVVSGTNPTTTGCGEPVANSYTTPSTNTSVPFGPDHGPIDGAGTG